MTHLFRFFIHFTDTDGTVAVRTLSTSPSHDHVWSFCQYTRSYSLRAQHDELSEKSSVGRNPNPFMERKLGFTKKRTHDFSGRYWWSNMFLGKEQGRHPLNFQQAGFERAGQEYEQSARDEVQVLLKIKQCKRKTSLQVVLSEIVSEATRWKTREEVCSMKQRQNFKTLKAKSRTLARISARCSAPHVRSSTGSTSPTGCGKRRS